MTRLLGVQIANGFSSEAKVFAQLLGGRDNRYDVRVVFQDWSKGKTDTSRFEQASGADLIRIDTGWRPTYYSKDLALKVKVRASSYLQFPYVMRRLVKTVQEWNPDVIYSCQQKWDCRAATLIASRLKKPQIIHLHYTIGPYLGKQPLARLLTCDHVITVSDFIRNEALKYGISSDRVTTLVNTMKSLPSVPPGAREDVRQELCIPLDAPLVGIVSRIDEGKGHADTIEAFVSVAKSNPTAHLIIIGDGLIIDSIRALARSKNMGNRILLCGFRSDIPRLLAAMDVFIHPSRMDPCPLATLEAAASGLPIVAYAEGGVCEQAVHGETGLLAKPGDITDLGRCLNELLQDPERARRMGEAGRWRTMHGYRPEDAALLFATTIEKVAQRK